MHALAQHLKAQGRGNDSMLVHMTPGEVSGLQSLAKSAGGSLTINPQTGLPEAGWLESLLPTLAGVAGGALGVDPYIAGLGGAAVQTAITGDLGKGLMAGLGAFGGASIGYGMLGGANRDTLGLNSNYSKGDVNLSDGISSSPTTGGITQSADGRDYIAAGQAPTIDPDRIVHNTAGIDPAKGSWGNFKAAAAAGTPYQNTLGSFAQYAPYAAALGVASPLLGSMDSKTASYNPATMDTTPEYKGPYTFAPRQVISKPNQLTNSSEHMYFPNPNDYQVIPRAAAGGLVALADGGVTTIAAPELYEDPSRGKFYGGGKPRTGADYLAMLGALPGGAPPPPAAPYKDYTFRPQASGAGEKNYGIVTPPGIDLTGGFSGGGGDPNRNPYAPTNDGTGPGWDGQYGSTGNRVGDAQFAGMGMGGYDPNRQYNSYGTGASGLGSLAGRVGDYASNFAKLPTSWTGDNSRQLGVNALQFVPGGQLAAPIMGGIEGFHGFNPAGSTGSGAGNLAGQSGLLQDLVRQGADYAYHNFFGGDYSAAEEAAPFNETFNKSAADLNSAYNRAHQQQMLAAQQQLGLASTAVPDTTADLYYGNNGLEPMGSNAFSAPWQSSALTNLIAATSAMSPQGSLNFGMGPLGTGDMGGGGGGWGGRGGGGGGGGDIEGFRPVSKQGSARGGPVHLGNNSFVMDARTVSEMGNGSSSAGQELLARLGGQPIHGAGDGVSDSIHANIGGKQEARVARDEVQFSPEAVARLGGGDTNKGSKFLYSLMAKAREARIKAAKKDGGRGVDTGLRALVGAK